MVVEFSIQPRSVWDLLPNLTHTCIAPMPKLCPDDLCPLRLAIFDFDLNRQSTSTENTLYSRDPRSYW